MNRYKTLYEQSMLAMQGILDNQYNNQQNPVIIPSFSTVKYKQMLFAKDMILCANRYVWKNLPSNLTSQQLESLFYKFGSLCFFKNNDGKLIVSRYATVGRLEPFGRLNKIIPIDFAGKSYGENKTVIDINGGITDTNENVAIVINDYTNDYQMMLENPRADLNCATTIADQVEVFRQLQNNIKLSIKKALALCDTEEQKRVVMAQLNILLDSSQPVIPIARSKNKAGAVDMPVEMWNFDNQFDTQNYCQQIDYYDKFRRSFNGIPAPDTFEKKERKITAEAENTNIHTNLVLLDGYLQRYNGLELIKKYLAIDGIEKVTVDIQDILKIVPTDEKENESETENNSEVNE